MKNLWVKDDSGNPTHSFKDRVVAVALAAARELGFTVLACPSTGNLANAVAAAARPGRHQDRRVHPRTTSSGRRSSPPRSTAARWSPSRATTTTSTGSLGDRRRARRAGRSSTSTSGPTTPRAPRRSATRSPSSSAGGCREQVVIPVASGSQLTKVDKGFAELGRARPGRGHAVQDLRRAGRGLLAGVGRVQGRPRRRPPGQAGHHRQVAGDRQPGRRPLRARRRPPHRRRGRGRHRRRGASTASSCWPAPRASSPRPPAASPSRR